MKRLLGIMIVIVLLVVIVIGYNLFGPVVNPPEGKYLYVRTGTGFEQLKTQLIEENIISGGFFFDKLSTQLELNKNIKPGRYLIDKRISLIKLVRMLRNGKQTPLKLVINKLRTKNDLANKLYKNFEIDSLDAIRFLNSKDSLNKFGVDTNTVMTLIIPNTYNISWNTNTSEFLGRMKSEHDKFWTDERIKKAADKGLNEQQVYTLASIVEEETNKQKDRLLIASTYLNRLKIGMRLQADPTIKYAMKDFSLKRIYKKYLDVVSPYNTYRNNGLPPGPIATPGINTIDAVLDAPETDYIYFVAKPSFDGYSNFATSYADHQKFARAYQLALDSLILARQKKDSIQ